MLLSQTKNELATVADLLKKLGKISPARIHHGGDVLPGLSLALRELFARLEEDPTRKKKPKR